MLYGASFSATQEAFKLSSPAFKDGAFIDLQYAGMGVKGASNISLPLSWEGAPQGTRSFALAMVDKTDGDFLYWAVVNLPSDADHINREASPWYMPYACSELRNGFGTIGYAGPDPAKGSGIHVYEITLYALNTTIEVKGNPSFEDIRHHIIDAFIERASIRGKFEYK